MESNLCWQKELSRDIAITFALAYPDTIVLDSTVFGATNFMNVQVFSSRMSVLKPQ